MDVNKYRNTTGKISEVMLTYIKDEDCEFSQKDVKACEKLLYDYLDALEKISPPTDKAIMKEVKKVVTALNRLNERTDCSLIETDEREMIWEVIQSAAVDCGLLEVKDDITEEWREW